MKKRLVIGSRHEQMAFEYEVYDAEDRVVEALTLAVSRRYETVGEASGKISHIQIDLIMSYFDGVNRKPNRTLHVDLSEDDLNNLEKAINNDETELRFTAHRVDSSEYVEPTGAQDDSPEEELVIHLLDNRRYAQYFLRFFVVINALTCDHVENACAYDKKAVAGDRGIGRAS